MRCGRKSYMHQNESGLPSSSPLFFVKCRLLCSQLGRRGLATIHRHFVADALTFLEVTQTRLLHRTHVDEPTPASVLRLDEAIPLLGVKPLDPPCCHPAHPL